MSNLIDIQAQIEKLQKQASDIRAKEFDKTVGEILSQMQAFGITVKDLQHAMSRGAAGKGRKSVGKTSGRKRLPAKPSATAGTTVAAKYRGPNGETWTGRGLMPKWLAALVAEGRSKDEFVISS